MQVSRQVSRLHLSPLSGLLLVVAFTMSACSMQQLMPNYSDNSNNLVTLPTLPADRTLIGTVVAQADCDCYDEMSYIQVASGANDRLLKRVQDSYPESDFLEISKVDLYLNTAVVHGDVYDCAANQGISLSSIGISKKLSKL